MTSSIRQQQPAPGREMPLPMQMAVDRATPVYGSAQPSGGLSEQLRRQAYSRPTHDPNRWLLLLGADRLEVSGSLIRETLVPGGQLRIIRHFARQARSYPMGFATSAIVIGGMLTWVVARLRSALRS